MATALAALMALPSVSLAPHPTPIDTLDRLRAALGLSAPRLYMKRDDLLSFGMGGNKVRKLQTVVAEARAAGADTLITCGGVQSNHARATAAAGSALGMRVLLVLNGARPAVPRANTLLDELFGAELHYVDSRVDRVPTMDRLAADSRAGGHRPFIVPLGASTATGAMGFARGVAEIATAGLKPDVIVHASSSGGTQAGLIAGCALFGLRARVMGVSADDPAAAIGGVVTTLLQEMAVKLGGAATTLGLDRPVDVDDRQVGEGYGIPTKASREALELVARREGIVLDPTYTAKAMAGLIAGIRAGAFGKEDTILFWHTGGQITSA